MWKPSREACVPAQAPSLLYAAISAPDQPAIGFIEPTAVCAATAAPCGPPRAAQAP